MPNTPRLPCCEKCVNLKGDFSTVPCIKPDCPCHVNGLVEVVLERMKEGGYYSPSRAIDTATPRLPNMIEEKMKEFRNEFYPVGDGCYCSHHPDDPCHTAKCYIDPVMTDVEPFLRSALIQVHNNALQAAEGALPKELDGGYTATLTRWYRDGVDVDAFNRALSQSRQSISSLRIKE